MTFGGGGLFSYAPKQVSHTHRLPNLNAAHKTQMHFFRIHDKYQLLHFLFGRQMRAVHSWRELDTGWLVAMVVVELLLMVLLDLLHPNALSMQYN